MPNAFVHIELNTDDVDQAKTFYQSLFKWKLGDMGPGYTGIDVGGGTGGGMQKKPTPEAPTAWLPYVQVDSVKTTIEKARALGAHIQMEYMEIGDMGAIGVFIDPTGAAIGLWEVTKTAKAKAPPAAKKPSQKPSQKPTKKVAPKATKKAGAKPAKKTAKASTKVTAKAKAKAKAKKPGKK